MANPIPQIRRRKDAKKRNAGWDDVEVGAGQTRMNVKVSSDKQSAIVGNVEYTRKNAGESPALDHFLRTIDEPSRKALAAAAPDIFNAVA
jgi:hypothetical protein